MAARRRRALVPQAVADYAPEFIVYTSRPDDASYQILMWLPYLQRAGLRFLVVTRNAVPAAALAGQTDVPVVEARGTADLEGLVVPSLKAVFYVNASSGNGALVRFQHLTHIYLGHGDSDKPPSYNPTHAMYDAVFAAGPGRHPPLRRARRPDPGGEVPRRRPAAGRGRPPGRPADRRRRRARSCSTRRPGGATSRRRCSTRCPAASRSSRPCWRAGRR